MKNSDLFDVLEDTIKLPTPDPYGAVEETWYYAKSRFNSWKSKSYPDRKDAVYDGVRHATVLKEAFPNLKGD